MTSSKAQRGQTPPAAGQPATPGARIEETMRRTLQPSSGRDELAMLCGRLADVLLGEATPPSLPPATGPRAARSPVVGELRVPASRDAAVGAALEAIERRLARIELDLAVLVNRPTM
jgi:hypothetical protein